MIRINLLPQARRGAQSAQVGTQIWGYVYLGSALVWGLALSFVYFSLVSDKTQALAQNAELSQQIERTKSQTGELATLQKQLEESKKLEDVIEKLRSGRQGPARLLVELSAVLSPGRGPNVDSARLETMRRSNPEAGFSPAWDTRRLWLTSFQERDRECRITGEARNNEDIAEFLRRISLSSLFEQVALVRTGQIAARTGTPSLAFELKCKVRY
jgi:type IV pilus assembly protein PilN